MGGSIAFSEGDVAGVIGLASAVRRLASPYSGGQTTNVIKGERS